MILEENQEELQFWEGILHQNVIEVSSTIHSLVAHSKIKSIGV